MLPDGIGVDLVLSAMDDIAEFVAVLVEYPVLVGKFRQSGIIDLWAELEQTAAAFAMAWFLPLILLDRVLAIVRFEFL